MWIIYILLVLLLAVLGFRLLSFLPKILRWIIVGFGVGILLVPIYVPHVTDYYSPAWPSAFFENFFTADPTNLGKLAFIRMLIGGGVGAGVGLVLSILLAEKKEEKYDPLYDHSEDPLMNETSTVDTDDVVDTEHMVDND